MIGVRLAEIAIELDDLASHVEERGITDADRQFLVAAHRHVQLAAEDLDRVLAVEYEGAAA